MSPTYHPTPPTVPALLALTLTIAAVTATHTLTRTQGLTPTVHMYRTPVMNRDRLTTSIRYILPQQESLHLMVTVATHVTMVTQVITEEATTHHPDTTRTATEQIQYKLPTDSQSYSLWTTSLCYYIVSHLVDFRTFSLVRII